MITLTQFWAVLSALATILPTVILAVREGKIKNASMDEVIDALIVVHSARVARAKKAGDDWNPLEGKSKWEV